MARVIALSRTIDARAQVEMLRMGVVCTCALALIAAGRALPF
jgi:hypothetical protein